MKIWYSPCKTGKETSIEIVNENKIIIDGFDFEFDANSIYWQDIYSQTEGKILDARRINGELHLKVLREYEKTCPWDTGDYQ